jgi:hypothetical protein
MSQPLLVAIFTVWTVTSLIAGVGFVRRAPATSLALFGSVCGAVVGFILGNADGPAGVPRYAAVGASVGVVSCGLLGLVTISARPPSPPLRRAAVLMLIAAPFTAAALTLLLQLACPLYVSGTDAGFCSYQDVDVLGGWVSGVVVAFLFDAMFVAGLLLLSARQAGGASSTRRRPARSADNVSKP